MTKIMTLSEFLHANETNHVSSIQLNSYTLLSLPLVEQIKELNENTKEFFHSVKVIYNYITNPILIWNGMMALSYWICLISCLSCFLMYLMTNRKKDIQRSKVALAVYIILKLIDSSIKSAI